MVLGERGLERCQGSAGRLNRSPGDDDEDEEFVDGDEMFFSPYKRRVLLLKIYFHILVFTSMAEDTAESESESEICSTCGRRVTTMIIIETIAMMMMMFLMKVMTMVVKKDMRRM